MRRAIRFPLLLPALFLLGCGGETVNPEFREEVAVFGFLYVGEAVNDSNAVLVTRTRPLDGFYQQEEAAVSGATVRLRREGSAEADTLMMISPGYYANPSVTIDSLTTYHLSVEVPGEEMITAATTTPVPFQVTGAPRERPGVMSYESIPDSFPLTLTCPDEEQIFLLDVYCQEDWRDARWIDPLGGPEGPEEEDEYGRENGEPRRIFAYFRIKNVERVADEYLIRFYVAMMVFWGRYEVNLLAIDDNYYNYLHMEHPEESGGIQGGIGVFGSACRRRYLVEVVE